MLEHRQATIWNQGICFQLEVAYNHEDIITLMILGCLVQVGNGIELEAVGLQFEPYRWRPCGVTWDSSRTFVVTVIKLRRTSAL